MNALPSNAALSRLQTRLSRMLVVLIAALSPVLSSCADDRSPAAPATLWAVGDGSASDASAEVVKRISSAPFDRLLYLGDVYEEGTAADFETNYEPTYGQVAEKTSPTPGNHDWGNWAKGYGPYWQKAHGEPIEPWYGFALRGWEVLSLNSEDVFEPGSAQERWLLKELSEQGTCRIVFLHRPRYSASTNHGDTPELDHLWNTLRGHAVMVISGHDHDMQRLKPIDGITQFVSGAGGRSLYQLDDDDDRLAFGNDDDYGALKLQLEPGRSQHSFVSADGTVLDRGEIRCEPLSG